MTAPIFHISRSSLHDGTGLRTVIYLKGCPLRCRWCHNPEGLSSECSILFRESRCIGCGRCLRVCPEHHLLQSGQHLYAREGCTACGRCAKECPNDALVLCGGLRTAEDVFREVKKDRQYYLRAGGGITLSGGECLLYPQFAAVLFALCRAEKISTCIETSFAVPWSHIEPILPLLDELIVDIKLADSKRHREYTGSGNGRILQNICRASQLHQNMRIRIPLIPGVSDGEDNLTATAELLNRFGEGIRSVELLKYNPMGQSKYDSLGLPFECFGESQTDEELRQKQEHTRCLLRAGIAVED